MDDRRLELLITEREAARRLGISCRTLWGLRNAGLIPFARIGRRLVRYAPADLARFIERHRHGGQPPTTGGHKEDEHA